MNKDFTGEVSTYNKKSYNILPPGEQFWDGLSDDEKKDTILIAPKNKKDENGNIIYNEYEDFVIKKVDKNGKPIPNIRFCIGYSHNSSTQCDEEYHKANKYSPNDIMQTRYFWVTDKNGVLRIPYNELPLYQHTLIEKELTTNTHQYNKYQEVKKEDEKLSKKKVNIYVDPGTRFLGEVPEKEFITYGKLIDSISQQGLNLGYEYSSWNSGWLKFYDAREDKTLYIAKTPVLYGVSWVNLYKAGVIFGPEVLHINKEKNKLIGEIDFEKLSQFGGYYDKSLLRGNYRGTILQINGKNYVVRLLRGHNTTNNKGDSNYYDIENYLDESDKKNKSEWNRYILPIIKDYRYGRASLGYLERALQIHAGKDDDFKIQVAQYNWFEDMNAGKIDNKNKYYTLTAKGQENWMQEYGTRDARLIKGSGETDFGASGEEETIPQKDFKFLGFRPVLEEIK